MAIENFLIGSGLEPQQADMISKLIQELIKLNKKIRNDEEETQNENI